MQRGSACGLGPMPDRARPTRRLILARTGPSRRGHRGGSGDMAGIQADRLGQRVLRDLDQPGGPILRPYRLRLLVRPGKEVVIDRAYIKTNTPAVRGRLVKAEVRLGGLLNQALSTEQREALDLRLHGFALWREAAARLGARRSQGHERRVQLEFELSRTASAAAPTRPGTAASAEPVVVPGARPRSVRRCPVRAGSGAESG
jgi:hypothetical protein